MSKKRDPLSVVIQYFNTSDLAIAEHGLTVVREIVRSRQPTTTKKKATPARRKPESAVTESAPN